MSNFFSMLMFLDQRRYVRYLCLPLARTKFKLDFSATDAAHCSTMQACFTYCVVIARVNASPNREATPRSANLFRELFQVDNNVFAKTFRFVPGVLKSRFVVPMNAPSCVRSYEQVFLKCFPMDSELQRR